MKRSFSLWMSLAGLSLVCSWLGCAAPPDSEESTAGDESMVGEAAQAVTYMPCSYPSQLSNCYWGSCVPGSAGCVAYSVSGGINVGIGTTDTYVEVREIGGSGWSVMGLGSTYYSTQGIADLRATKTNFGMSKTSMSEISARVGAGSSCSSSQKTQLYAFARPDYPASAPSATGCAAWTANIEAASGPWSAGSADRWIPNHPLTVTVEGDFLPFLYSSINDCLWTNATYWTANLPPGQTAVVTTTGFNFKVADGTCATANYCNDSAQDNGETGVDCGGSCAPCTGAGPQQPATTCAGLHDSYPWYPSGMYWVGASGSAAWTYCDMTTGTANPVILDSIGGFDLAVDGSTSVTSTTVYFTDGLGGAVRSLPAAGGLSSTVVQQEGPDKITRWVNYTSGRVVWVDNTGLMQAWTPATSTLTPLQGQQAYSTDLSTRGTLAYFIEDAGSDFSGNSLGRLIRKAPLSGGAATTLGQVTDFAHVTAEDGTNVYFASDLEDNTNSGRIGSVPVSLPAGTTPSAAVTVLATGLPPVNLLTQAGSYLYWTDASGRVVRMHKTTKAQTVIAQGQDNPRGIVTDGTNVYWANYGHWDAAAGAMTAGSVKKVPVGGGSVTVISTGDHQPARVAVDATRVYWITADYVKGTTK